MESQESPVIPKEILVFVMLMAGIFLIASLYIPASHWESKDHPPQVNISRSNENITVVYLGGTDDGFVGDFKIIVDNHSYYFKKPRYINSIVGNVTVGNYSCVEVMAMDLAIQQYRDIGYVCL